MWQRHRVNISAINLVLGRGAAPDATPQGSKAILIRETQETLAFPPAIFELFRRNAQGVICFGAFSGFLKLVG